MSPAQSVNRSILQRPQFVNKVWARSAQSGESDLVLRGDDEWRSTSDLSPRNYLWCLTLVKKEAGVEVISSIYLAFAQMIIMTIGVIYFLLGIDEEETDGR